jgi:D-serine deaminase-like pyridoxal phosphate-dependent protein
MNTAQLSLAPATLFDLPTPALLLDRRRLEQNAERMRRKVEALGVALRPHVKTCKSIDVLRILAPGGGGITVSTLAEARYFFDHGVTDILYAVGLAPVKLPQVAGLIRQGCALKVIVDTVEAARAVSDFAAAEGVGIEALIELDTDGHRAGVTPEDPLLIEIAVALESGGKARLGGVMTHAGASYGCRTPADFERIAEQERAGAVRAAERLRAAGFACPTVSVGSTPTITYARHLEGVTEARVGVYAFGDLVQSELGTCTTDDIAISVLASVISHKPALGRIIVDAGFLALSRDRGTADLPVDWGYGAVCDAETGELLPDLIVSATNQEHGIITSRSGSLDFARHPIGSRLRVLPNHACATAAAYDRYQLVADGGAIEGEWPRVTGW